MSASSCLTQRLERFMELSESDAQFVAQMEKDEQPVKRGEVLVENGDPVTDLMVLKSGWALVQASDVATPHAILRVYLPGEVIGFAELGRSNSVHKLVMKTDGVICPFPRHALTEMFAHAPRLAGLLFSLNSLEQIALREQLKAVGHLSGLERCVHLLLALRDRSDLAKIGNRKRFPLPLTQSEIGSCLGLTKEYVGRIFRSLRQDGQLHLQDKYVRVLNPSALEKRVAYVSTYDQVDTDWYCQKDAQLFFEAKNEKAN